MAKVLLLGNPANHAIPAINLLSSSPFNVFSAVRATVWSLPERVLRCTTERRDRSNDDRCAALMPE